MRTFPASPTPPESWTRGSRRCTTLAVSLLAAFALVITACGGSTESSESSGVSPTTEAVAAGSTTTDADASANDADGPGAEATATPIPEPTATPQAEPEPTATAAPDGDGGDIGTREEAIAFLEGQAGLSPEVAACTADAGFEIVGSWNIFDVSSAQDAALESVLAECSGEPGDAATPASTLASEREEFIGFVNEVGVMLPEDAACLADAIYEIFGFYGLPDELTDQQALQTNVRAEACVTEIGGPAAGSAPPGTDAELDELWLECSDGDGASCDLMYQISPVGSDYEAYGWTCGGITVFDDCADAAKLDTEFFDDLGNFDLDQVANPDDPPPGDDAALDALWVECSAEVAASCDQLFVESPSGSDYEAFGWTCGGRTPSESCTALFGTPSPGSDAPGDDAALDALWDDCGAGDAGACETLFYESPLDSVYEAWGLSCGGSPDRTLPCDE